MIITPAIKTLYHCPDL